MLNGVPWPPPWADPQAIPEYPTTTGVPELPTPPPPPPPPTKKLGKTGPVTSPDELPAGAVPDKLSPEEEAKIEIDQPKLTPQEEAEIQIDQQSPPAGEGGPVFTGPGAPVIGYPHAPQSTAPPPNSDLAVTSPHQLQAPDFGLVTSPGQSPLTPPGEPVTSPSQVPDAGTYDFGPDRGPPIKPGPESSVQDLAAYYERHPEALIRDRAERDAAARTQYYNDLADRRRQENELRDREHADFQTAMASAAKTQQDIANTKIDPHAGEVNWFAGAVLGGLGGLGLKANGGRNIVIEALNQRIQTSIDTQKSNLANRQNALNQFVQETGDMHVAEQKYRAGVWNGIAAELETKLQDFDPKGTQARDIATQIITAKGEAQKAAAAGSQLDFKNKLEALKGASEATEKIAAANKADAETAKIRGQLGAGEGPAVYGATFSDLNQVPAKDRNKAFRLPTKNGVPGGWVVATNEDTAKDASHLVRMYSNADYDLNELQRISLEREGAKSAGGSLWKKWETNNEQHYRQLVTDVANTYGMMIHGRAPTAGVLEEVLKDMPELKSMWERGDTTDLIDKFRNDIDNRMTLSMQGFGANTKISSDRPRVDKANSNTLTTPLIAAPVKGDKGYARFDMKNFGESLQGVLDRYVENPGLGEPSDLEAQFNDVAIAQRKAASEINTEIVNLQSKKKRTPDETERLEAARRALLDRQEAVRETEDFKKSSLDKLRKKRADEATKQQIDDAVGQGPGY